MAVMTVSSRSIVERSARLDVEGIDFSVFLTKPLAVNCS
jgi:hypothetical protein